jgi:hypothetical protein
LKQAIDKQKALGRVKNITKCSIMVDIAMDMCVDIKMFMESCKLNGTNIGNLFTMIFDLGYSLYKKFVIKGVTSVPEMDRVCSFASANLESIMQLSYTECVFDTSAIVEILKLRNEQSKYLNGIGLVDRFFKSLELNDIRSVFGNDKFVLNGNDIRILFNRYVEKSK